MAGTQFLKELGARIRKQRKQMDITQEQLAEKMDVSVQMISNLEQGKKAIRPENLVKLCLALSVSSDYILTGRHHPVSTDSSMEGKLSSLSPQKQKLLEEIINSWLEP